MSDQNPKKKSLLRRWGPLLAILALLAISYFAGLGEYISLSSLVRNQESLSQFVADNAILASLVFVGLYAFLVALSFPGATLMTLAAGLLFGGMIGGVLTVFAATLGATILFLVARSSLGDFLEDSAGGLVNKMKAGVQ